MVTPVMEAQSQKNWAAIRPGALCVCATQPRARQDVALISEGHSAVNDSCESENIFESDYLPGSASDTAENSDGDKSFYPLLMGRRHQLELLKAPEDRRTDFFGSLCQDKRADGRHAELAAGQNGTGGAHHQTTG